MSHIAAAPPQYLYAFSDIIIIFLFANRIKYPMTKPRALLTLDIARIYFRVSEYH